MVNYILAADTVPYGFAPQTAALVAGHKLIVDPPPKFAFAPQPASLAFGRQIVAAPAVFGFAPQDATLAVGHKLVADAVAFGFSPQPAVLAIGKSIAADPVAFGFAPQDAVLAYGRIMFADPVIFTADPQDAVLAVLMHTLFADAVMFDFAPQNATATPTINPEKPVEPFDIPEFDRQTSWTVSINNSYIIFAGFSPLHGAFFVRYTDGGFTLWLNQSQGVMRGLLLAPDQRVFLQNLGRPFLASF